MQPASLAFVYDGATILNLTSVPGDPNEPVLWDVPYYLILNTVRSWSGACNAKTLPQPLMAWSCAGSERPVAQACQREHDLSHSVRHRQRASCRPAALRYKHRDSEFRVNAWATPRPRVGNPNL